MVCERFKIKTWKLAIRQFVSACVEIQGNRVKFKLNLSLKMNELLSKWRHQLSNTILQHKLYFSLNTTFGYFWLCFVYFSPTIFKRIANNGSFQTFVYHSSNVALNIELILWTAIQEIHESNFTLILYFSISTTSLLQWLENLSDVVNSYN